MSKTKKKMPNWLNIALRVIEWTLIIFIFVCMLILVSQKITGETPHLFGYSTYTVVTNSMAGTYDVGDVVICKRIKDPIKYNSEVGFKSGDIGEGDVIAFIAPSGFDKYNRLQGQTVTHRIVTEPYYDEESDTWFVETKGDASLLKDSVPIPLENIQGIIVGSSKHMSKLFAFLSKPYGFILIIVIPLLGILMWQIVVLIKGKTQIEKDKMAKENIQAVEALKIEKDKKIEEIKKQAIEEYKTNKEK